jgi:hypothetical protein
MNQPWTFGDDIFDLYECQADAFINCSGKQLILYFPSSVDECANCVQDPMTGRSSAIFKEGGPVPFRNHTTCPVCAGEGRALLPPSAVMPCRIYWEPSSYKNLAVSSLESPDGIVRIIAYAIHSTQLQRATQIEIATGDPIMGNIKCKREGPPLPHGLRKDGQARYFQQRLRRI